jgi:hypothetical protein
VKVAKPFPWGTVVGSAVIGLALIGLLVYAATNQGSGIENPDTSIDGVVVADADALTRGHVDGPVEYEQNPPNGGDHNGAPQTCAVYDEPIAPEHACTPSSTARCGSPTTTTPARTTSRPCARRSRAIPTG